MNLKIASLAELQYLARHTDFRYLALIEFDRRNQEGELWSSYQFIMS